MIKIKMMNIRQQDFYFYVILGLLIAMILIPNSPVIKNFPGRDSGVYLYIGEQILDGSIPYRDVWDHKGPVIYYINAFGLLIGQGTRWGILFLEFLSLYFAALLGYIVMRQAFGNVPAIFASILWLISLVFVLEGGNLTEEFVLPLQFASLYFFWRLMNSGLNLGYTLLIGVTFALSFLLRPNNVGIQLSIAILIFISGILSPRRHESFMHMLALFFGAIIIIIPVIIYFASNNALDNFFDSIFRYNAIYSTSTLRNRADSVFTGLGLLMKTGMPITALTAWIVGCLSVLLRGINLQSKWKSVLYLALIGLPIELLFTSISGRGYGHYFITWLPIFAILSGLFVFGFLQNFSSSEVTFLERKINFGTICIFALLVSMAVLPFRKVLPSVVKILLLEDKPEKTLVATIRSYTDDDGYLLMWGAETSINFLTKRRSPSRFVYQYPLFTCGYYTEDMIEEFLGDIVKKKPTIIDTQNRHVPPIDDDRREKWINVPFGGEKTGCEMSTTWDKYFKFVNSNYRVVGSIENQWLVYKYVNRD